MNRLILVVIPFLFLSCQQEKEETMDLRDIIPESTRYSEDQLRENSKQDTFPKFETSKDLKYFADSLKITVVDIDSLSCFLDRFPNAGKENYSVSKNEKQGTLDHYAFKDSSQTKTAFFNWLDRFGDGQQEILLYQERNLKSAPFYLVVLEDRLIYLKGSIIEEVNWEEFLAFFEDRKILFVLKKQDRRKIEWWEFTEKWQLIKQENDSK